MKTVLCSGSVTRAETVGLCSAGAKTVSCSDAVETAAGLRVPPDLVRLSRRRGGCTMSAPVSTLSAAIITNLASSPLPDPSQAFRGYIKTQRRPPHHDPPLSSWCILPPLELPDDLPGCSMRPPNPLAPRAAWSTLGPPNFFQPPSRAYGRQGGASI